MNAGSDTLIAEVNHRCKSLETDMFGKKRCSIHGPKKPKACSVYPSSFEGRTAIDRGMDAEGILIPGCSYKWDDKKKGFV